MSSSLAVVLGLAAITLVWKGAGSLLHRVPTRVAERLGGLAPALLAALVVTQLVDRNGIPRVDARLVAVAVAVVLAWRRAHLGITVVAAAAVAAGLRAAGWA